MKVPMLKLIGLIFLLISVHRGSRWRPRDRTKLYRIVEAVGPLTNSVSTDAVDDTRPARRRQRRD